MKKKLFISIFSVASIFILSFTGKEYQKNIRSVNRFTTDTLFYMCQVMPGPEVAALSPFGNPFKSVEPHDQMDGYTGCHYYLSSDDDYPQVDITLTDFGTAAEARVSYNIWVESFHETFGRNPDTITGLCDIAGFAGNADPALCDICAVVALSGRYRITVGFKGYYSKITADQKKTSGINIVKALLRKEPFLVTKK
ncbi:MAG: hypothetical protein JWM28_4070 [Chitinophagaceae bacterium]|nr:hypothetical protein [Chitinophagaceae bacterium]